MATNDPNKQALKKNRLAIVADLQNPDMVADQLFSIGLFNDDMRDEVLQTTTTENKTRKILDTLHRRGPQAAKGLHEAFMNTSNEELAKLLVPYIKQIQSEGNKITPEVWPPSPEDQKKMEADPVKRIPNLHSHYIHKYTSTEVQ